MSRTAFRWWFVLIVVAAGLWRVVYVLVAKHDEPVVGDQSYYAAQAVTIAAVYANLWMNDGLLMSETFAAAGVVAILLAVYVYDLRRSNAMAAVAGVAVGVAGLARAELLLLGPLVVVPMVLLAPSNGRPPQRTTIRWQHVVVSGVAAVIVVAP